MFKFVAEGASLNNAKNLPVKKRVGGGRGVFFESLESRQLLSGVGLAALSEATVLRTMALKATANAAGNVGGLVSDNLYRFDVTGSINLDITLSNLKQSDSVTLLFADGSGLSTGSTNGSKAAGFFQRLDPGTYYLDIGTG